MQVESSGEAEVLGRPAPPADARIRYGTDASQFGDLRLPAGPGPHPVGVVLHGGFWRARYGLDHIGHLCAALAREGLATWSLEYRRLGQRGGGWPGTLEDVAAGLAHLAALTEEYRLDPRRVVTIGHSAGGHLALWLASHSRAPVAAIPGAARSPIVPCGVVSLAGVADLRRAAELELSQGVVRELLGGGPDRVPERFAAASPIERLPLGLPQVLVHGVDDAIVPIEIAERYSARARELGDAVELIRLPNTGHFELIDPQARVWPTVAAAVLSIAATRLGRGP